MRTITVEKAKLIEALKENRERHVNTFDQVMEDYRTQAIRQLDEHIERIKSGAVEEVAVYLPAPKNYEEEYDRAIAMMEWERAEEVELDMGEFDRYVRDNWAWKRDFNETVATYSVEK